MARQEGESIYRHVAVRMWGDERVRKLSKPQPNGQSLWVALIAGEQTTIIPGLFKIGEAGFAEQLEWPLDADPSKGIAKGFRDAFREVAEQGMVKADWKARLVFVPKAIFHNKPASPNVIIHWRDAWDLLPECDLKTEAWQHLRAFCEDRGLSWLESFDKSCPKASCKASPNQGAGSREQGAVEESEGGRPATAPALPPPQPLTLIPPKVVQQSPLLLYLAKEFAQATATPENEKAWQEAFPGVDLLAEAKNARRWELDNPKLIKTQKRRFLGNWFGRAQNNLRAVPQGRSLRASGAAQLQVDSTALRQETPGRKFLTGDKK